jgi:hypothetical protein
MIHRESIPLQEIVIKMQSSCSMNWFCNEINGDQLVRDESHLTQVKVILLFSPLLVQLQLYSLSIS